MPGAAETARLIASLSLDDKGFSKGVSSAIKSVDRLDKRVSKIGSTAGRGAGTAIKNVGKAVAIGTAGIVAGLTASVKVASDFEAQLNVINTIAHATKPELDAIGNGIRNIAKTTGTATEDLTAAYYDLLSAGIKTKDAQNVLTQANTLAIGGLATTAETVDLLTTAINAYGGDASKAAQYTDDFAKAIELGKTTAADIAASFGDVGAVAAQNGIQVREIAAAYGDLTSQGINAAEVTTQMNRAIIELLKPGADLIKLQKTLHKNYADLAKQNGLVPTLEEMRKDAEKVGIPFQDLFGRLEGYKFALETTGANNAKFNETMRLMGEDAGTAAKQMGERQKGLAFQLGVLKANVKDAGITIGTALLPRLAELAAKLTTALTSPEAQRGIQTFADNLAKTLDRLTTNFKFPTGADIAKTLGDVNALINRIVDAMLKVDWAAFGTAFSIASTGAKAVLDAFLSMPSWVQTAVITGWGLNKLTGGALTDIFGQGIKLTFDQFLGRGANPGNPLYVADVAGLAGAAEGAGLIGGISLATVGLIATAAVASTWAFLQTHHSPTDTGAFTPTLGAAFDSTNRPGADKNVADFFRKVGNAAVAIENGTANIGDQAKLANVHNERMEALQTQTVSALASIQSEANAHAADLLAGLKALPKAQGEEARKQAKIIATSILGGAGNAANTRKALDELRAAQAAALKSGNKQLARDLGVYIKQVESKLPNRVFVQGKLDELAKIRADGKITKDETAELKRIQSDLLAHGDTHAASIIQKTIDQTSAINAGTAAIVGAIKVPQLPGDTHSETVGIQNAAGAARNVGAPGPQLGPQHAADTGHGGTITHADGKALNSTTQRVIDSVKRLAGDTRSEQSRTRQAIAVVSSSVKTQGQNDRAAIAGVAAAQRATTAAAHGTTAAVNAKDLSVDVEVPINLTSVVSIRGFGQQQRILGNVQKNIAV